MMPPSAQRPPCDAIRLRPFRAADGIPLFEYITDPEVNRQLVIMLPTDMQMFVEAAARMTMCYDNDFCFVVAEETSDFAIGFARLKVEDDASANILYFLGRKFWHRGYGGQIVKHLIQLGFGRLGLARLKAQVFVGNPYSIRLLQRAGFRIVSSAELGGSDRRRAKEVHLEASADSFLRPTPLPNKPFGERLV